MFQQLVSDIKSFKVYMCRYKVLLCSLVLSVRIPTCLDRDELALRICQNKMLSQDSYSDSLHKTSV